MVTPCEKKQEANVSEQSGYRRSQNKMAGFCTKVGSLTLKDFIYLKNFPRFCYTFSGLWYGSSVQLRHRLVDCFSDKIISFLIYFVLEKEKKRVPEIDSSNVEFLNDNSQHSL